MKDECSALENAPASLQGAMDREKAVTEDKDMEYDEHFLILAEMTPTTTADVEALDMAELQEAVVASIAHLQGADDLERETVIVNVFSGAADPYWGDLMPAPKRNLQATNIFSKTHNFKVGGSSKQAVDAGRRGAHGVLSSTPFTTSHRIHTTRPQQQFVTVATDRKTSEVLAEAMMPQVAGEESPLAQQIKETFKAYTVRVCARARVCRCWSKHPGVSHPNVHHTAQGVEIGHMGLEYDREMYVPAYNSDVRGDDDASTYTSCKGDD